MSPAPCVRIFRSRFIRIITQNIFLPSIFCVSIYLICFIFSRIIAQVSTYWKWGVKFNRKILIRGEICQFMVNAGGEPACGSDFFSPKKSSHSRLPPKSFLPTGSSKTFFRITLFLFFHIII